MVLNQFDTEPLQTWLKARKSEFEGNPALPARLSCLFLHIKSGRIFLYIFYCNIGLWLLQYCALEFRIKQFRW